MEKSPSIVARSPRSDATRNRAVLLEAATAVFDELGADASLEEVARRAKVGIGTLYRHFPTRQALLVAASEDRLLALAAATRASRGSTLHRFTRYVERVVEHTNHCQGLAAAYGVIIQGDTPGCQEATAQGEQLLELAQREGEIRKDVTFDEVLVLATGLAIAVAQGPADAKRTARFVQILVSGLRPAPGRARSRSSANS